ncbi:MAG: hypothetical protein RL338_476 [Chloroflexota bacterium]
MSVEGMIVVAMGIGFAVYGFRRASRFWGDYRALAAQQANVERYERWRGGVREGPAGPTEAMRDLRRRAAIHALIVVLGIGFVLEGIALG